MPIRYTLSASEGDGLDSDLFPDDNVMRRPDGRVVVVVEEGKRTSMITGGSRFRRSKENIIRPIMYRYYFVV
jgi:hypothetical protein